MFLISAKKIGLGTSLGRPRQNYFREIQNEESWALSNAAPAKFNVAKFNVAKFNLMHRNRAIRAEKLWCTLKKASTFEW